MKICRKGLHQYEGKCCKECNKANMKAWREANKEQLNAAKKVYYEANKEQEKVNMKVWYEANKEQRKANTKAWREANKEQHKANTKAWREANKEQHKANTKAYRKANRDKCNALGAKYRAKKLKATPKWLTKAHFEQIEQFYKEAKELELHNNIKFDVDHIVPLQGKLVSGLHVPWNLQVITTEDNRKKSNKLLAH